MYAGDVNPNVLRWIDRRGMQLGSADIERLKNVVQHKDS
jgi:hypothetical protein